MPYYQVTNTAAVIYNDGSLVLNPGETTTLHVASLPVIMNPAIIAETLVVVNLGDTLGAGSGDVITDIIAVSYPASTSSQIIAAVQATRLPPGVHILNSTFGDVAIKASAVADASFQNADVILAPGEDCYVTADYVDAVKAICEVATGFIVVKVFY